MGEPGLRGLVALRGRRAGGSCRPVGSHTSDCSRRRSNSEGWSASRYSADTTPMESRPLNPSRMPVTVARASARESGAGAPSGGYSALSLGKVAQRAGVHKTTLYRRWGTREELVLEAMLERAGEHISVPDTGSLRRDLLELARTAAANAASPEVSAMARAVAAESPHDSRLAEANQRFWAERLALDAAIVERAIERGEVAAGTDPRQAIETVLGPIHLRLLLTGEPVDRPFLEGIVDMVVDGIAPGRDHR
ncbi:MAG: TetR/AcrR family transcriptional regulator [Thermoleophilaceae bacterium]